MSVHQLEAATAEASTIVIETGAALDLATLLPSRDSRRRVALVTQPPVGRLAADVADGLRGAGLDVVAKELPDRDEAKTLSVVEHVCAWMGDHGLGRSDTIVAVGGGALTDAAGFAASIYLRGIEAVYVPTTLLGAVDASIGGKTAVNVGGKNLAGTFHHPALVVIDPGVLARLPAPLLVEGAAEALKTGLVGDAELVALYETHGLDAPIDEVIERAVAVKVAVVGADYREGSRREILNYGHTIGHAVETAAGIPHGHAVAIGMVAAGAVAETSGFAGADRQRAVIEDLGLPTAISGLEPDLVRALVAKDKKRGPEGTRMVILEDIALPKVTNVSDATVTAALAAVGIG